VDGQSTVETIFRNGTRPRNRPNGIGDKERKDQEEKNLRAENSFPLAHGEKYIHSPKIVQPRGKIACHYMCLEKRQALMTIIYW
jgi:hypothetical protein